MANEELTSNLQHCLCSTCVCVCEYLTGFYPFVTMDFAPDHSIMTTATTMSSVNLSPVFYYLTFSPPHEAVSNTISLICCFLSHFITAS